MNMIIYLRTRWKCAAYCGALFAAFHFYFFFLIPGGRWEYLLYLDFLLVSLSAFLAVLDYGGFARGQRERRRLLEREDLICREYPAMADRELAEHDMQILEEQLEERFQENCELQDYVAKWCHELKLPLAAALLLNERIHDTSLRSGIREQLERMKLQITSMLLGCRLQGALFDLQVQRTALGECVRTSIRNNQFFLIQKRFVLTVETGDALVYTDPAWLVYVLDQLISNAVKYAKEEAPVLRIWAEQENGAVKLLVEDHGVGIRDCDLPRIFEKGFTGQNTHNGRYKSTGLGLYMAAKIAGQMGHELTVESEYGSYTRFGIIFRENDYFW